MKLYFDIILIILTTSQLSLIHGLLEAYFYLVPPQGTIDICDSYKNDTTIATILDQPAIVHYEDEFPRVILGYVIIAHPIDACSKVNPPPIIQDDNNTSEPIGDENGRNETDELENDKMDWILLAKRSNICTYEAQLQFAKAAGYKAIIVYNVSNDTEVIGQAEEKDNKYFDLIIPAFSVGEYDGIFLKEQFMKNLNKRYFIIMDTPPAVYKDFIFYTVWSVFGIFIGIVLCCIGKPFYECAIQPWLLVRYKNRRRALLARAVSALAIIEWKEELLERFESCVICMEFYMNSEQLRILPCNHGFHTNCIDSWLLKVRRVCPICKEKIVYSSCWEDCSDSDISEGNYFTDIAFEPSSSSRRPHRNYHTNHGFRSSEFSIIGSHPDVHSSSTSTSIMTLSSVGSSSSSLSTSEEEESSSENASGEATASASFIFCTVSVHEEERESRSNSPGES